MPILRALGSEEDASNERRRRDEDRKPKVSHVKQSPEEQPWSE